MLIWMTGIVPSLILTIFLGVFALYTAKLLIDFKLNHPEVHNMGRRFDFVVVIRPYLRIIPVRPAGDAGFIMFGPIGREIFSIGTIIFAVFAVVSVVPSLAVQRDSHRACRALRSYPDSWHCQCCRITASVLWCSSQYSPQQYSSSVCRGLSVASTGWDF